jgi:hypothetical protein
MIEIDHHCIGINLSKDYDWYAPSSGNYNLSRGGSSLGRLSICNIEQYKIGCSYKGCQG